MSPQCDLDMWFDQVMYVTLFCDISMVTIEITLKEDYFIANKPGTDEKNRKTL